MLALAVFICDRMLVLAFFICDRMLVPAFECVIVAIRSFSLLIPRGKDSSTFFDSIYDEFVQQS